MNKSVERAAKVYFLKEANGEQACSGKDSRVPPSNPMGLFDARWLVDDLLKKWLAWKGSEKNSVGNA